MLQLQIRNHMFFFCVMLRIESSDVCTPSNCSSAEVLRGWYISIPTPSLQLTLSSHNIPPVSVPLNILSFYFVAHKVQLMLPICYVWGHPPGHGNLTMKIPTPTKEKQLFLPPLPLMSSARGGKLGAHPHSLLEFFNSFGLLRCSYYMRRCAGMWGLEGNLGCFVISLMGLERETISSKKLGPWDPQKELSRYYWKRKDQLCEDRGFVWG